MHFGQLESVAKTLRFRLTAWFAAAMLLLAFVTLVGVREGVRRTLLSEFDELLEEDLLEIRLTMKQVLPDRDRFYRMLESKAQGHMHHRWFVQLFDLAGQLEWQSEDAPETGQPPIPRRGMYLLNVAPYRMVQCVVNEPGLPPRILCVGASREYVDSAVSLLTRLAIIAGGFSLCLAPLGGYVLAGRATQPLARIIATTAQLDPRHLHERLPIRRSGDELDQLSHTINAMLDRIGSYLDQNRDFVANAAHELRSPLTAIRSSVEVALDGPRSTREYTDLLGDVAEECTSLGNLVNRLLLLAEGDAGRIALKQEPARLDDVTRRSVEMFQGVAESRRVELLMPQLAAVEVYGDVAYLRQVVQNLIDNAIKFTPPEGRVSVEVLDNALGGLAELRVTDTGSGIPTEDLPRIFERFYRGDKSRHHETGQRGNGLGLSICHTIVTALHGRIAVESTPGRGSTFRVFLPLRNLGTSTSSVALRR